MTSTSCIFSRLDSDIINRHILPRLDGADLTALSSVSSYLRYLICNNNNNQDLWRNICTSKWPSLMDPGFKQVISAFPGGYHSFFSDAFPSLHHRTNSHCSYPPSPDLIHAVDMYIDGEPVFSRIGVESFDTEEYKYWCIYFISDVTCYGWKRMPMGHIRIPVNASWIEYLQENLKLSWIVIHPTRKRAASLFRYTCKPISVTRRRKYKDVTHEVVYGTVIAGECQVRSEMVNCHVKVMCCKNGGDGLDVMRVVIEMEDMNRDLVTVKQGVSILHNAIQNGQRKKFDLPKQEFDKFQISDLQRKKNRKRK